MATVRAEVSLFAISLKPHVQYMRIPVISRILNHSLKQGASLIVETHHEKLASNKHVS